ncbi:hypothetical protein LTR53_002526 [Teratosphaeriaceae sp. CCFEE 6253]|nr:hypothetical protein LTR53_002526 [Teratosphaeriaceae sp. CCFEE 6253]
MSFFENTPLISTGNPTIDAQCSVAFSLVVLFALYTVARAFTHVDRKEVRRRRDGHPNAVRTFYVLALVSLVTVTWLRAEHRRIQLVSIADVNAFRQSPALRHVPVIGKEPVAINVLVRESTERLRLPTRDDLPSPGEVASGAKHAVQGGASAAADAFHAGGHAAEAVADFDPAQAKKAAKKEIFRTSKNVQKLVNEKAEQAYEGAKTAAQRAGSRLHDGAAAMWRGEVPVPETLAEAFPWAGGIVGANASVWDFFKSLIDTAQRYWWTQQWLAGYVMWAVYVGIECYRRGFPPLLAPSLVLLGWCTSLASLQCLFFALLLQTPRLHRTSQQWPPPLVPVLGPGIAGLICVWALGVETRAGWLNALQAGVMLGPVVGAWWLAVSPAPAASPSPSHRAIILMCGENPQNLDVKSFRARAVTPAPPVLALYWYTLGSLSLLSYLLASYSNYTTSAPYSTGRWWALPTWATFHKTAGNNNHPLPHILHSLATVLRALGDHAWLNAVGWDVVFSALTLSAWAALHSADPRGIFTCALWPWLDGTLEVAEQAAGYVQQTTEPYVEATTQYAGEVGATLRKTRRYVDGKSRDLGVNAGLEKLGAVGQRAVSSAAQLVTGHGGEEADEDKDAEFDGRALRRRSGHHAPDAAREARARRDYDSRAAGRKKDGHEEGEDWDEVRSRKSPSPTKRRGRPPKERSASEGPEATRSSSRVASRSRTRNTERAGSPAKRRSSRLRNLTEPAPGTIADRLAHVGWLPGRQGLARGLQGLHVPTAGALGVTGEEAVQGAEAAGVALALWALGGLGLVGAGVYGADGLA